MSNSTSSGLTFQTPTSTRVPVTVIATLQTTVSVPSISFSRAAPSTTLRPSDLPPPSSSNAQVPSLTNTAIIIISVSAAVIILALGAVLTCLHHRKQRQKKKNGSFFPGAGSSKAEKSPISLRSTTSSFSARPPPSMYPQSQGYKDTVHSPLLQEAWRPSYESSSEDYVVRESQNYDSNATMPPITTPLPSHTRTPSQSTTITYSSEDTVHANVSAPIKMNPSPYRQSIPLPLLSIPSPPPSSTTSKNIPPPPPPPPSSNPPRRQSSRRTYKSYDSDGSESLYSQASCSPETPAPLTSITSKSYTTHTTYQSTILLPSAIDQNYQTSNVYSFPSNPARASSVFSAHPQFVDIPGLPGRAAPVPIRQPDLEEDIRKPSESLYAPIQPVIIRYDTERTGPPRGDTLIIGKLLKSRAMQRESNSTSGTSVSRNSSLVSHIERQGSIKGVSSPLISDGGLHRSNQFLSRQPSTLSTTVEGYYFDEQEPMPTQRDFPHHAAADAPSPTGAAEGGMFSPMSPPSSSSVPSNPASVKLNHFDTPFGH